MKVDLKQLSLEELLKLEKKRKSNYRGSAFFVGMMVGVAIFSIYRNGVTASTFVPLVFLGLTANAKKEYDEVKKEIKLRNETI